MKKPARPRKENCPQCPLPGCPNCPLKWDEELPPPDKKKDDDSLLNEYGVGIPNFNFPNDYS